MTNNFINEFEKALSSHQFELILKDDYEAIHFVDWVSWIYSKMYWNEQAEVIKQKLLKALSKPGQIDEEDDESEDGLKEGHIRSNWF